MKASRVLSCMVVIFSLCGSLTAQTEGGASESKQALSQLRPESDTLRYAVYGMDCPACAGGLEKQIKKIPSVHYTEADWYRQELKIVVKQDSLLSLQELEKRVQKANFTLGDQIR